MKDIKNIITKYNFRPKKRLGQNFLISENVLKKIIDSAQLKKTDIVLEIGPGTGILTKELAKKVKEVITIEKDKELVVVLKEELAEEGIKNVEVVREDILKIQNSKTSERSEQVKMKENLSLRIQSSRLKNKNYKIVANLPYYITAPIIKMFLEEPPSGKLPELMVLMVQKEVGERICALPPKMSKIAVFSQFYGKSEIVGIVSKNCFWPRPKVDSAILKITPLINSDGKLINADRNLFSKIVKAGFSHPRKQLINNLSKELDLPREKTENWLAKNNIEPSRRAETLTVKNWLDLTKTLTS